MQRRSRRLLWKTCLLHFQSSFQSFLIMFQITSNVIILVKHISTEFDCSYQSKHRFSLLLWTCFFRGVSLFICFLKLFFLLKAILLYRKHRSLRIYLLLSITLTGVLLLAHVKGCARPRPLLGTGGQRRVRDVHGIRGDAKEWIE